MGWRLTGYPVALRKESVDRNTKKDRQIIKFRVALRKESVDRNYRVLFVAVHSETSLSARRAWIEIPVDTKKYPDAKRRSPQGERG